MNLVRQCRRLKTPLLIIIDGSMALWNGVLKAMCGTGRLEYYNRCYRIATGNPNTSDLNKTIVVNCYSHAMKAAKMLCMKHCSKKMRKPSSALDKRPAFVHKDLLIGCNGQELNCSNQL